MRVGAALCRGRRPEMLAMLSKGDLFPHVIVRRVDGREFSYADVWQRRILVLVTLSASGLESGREDARYLAMMAERRTAFDDYEAEVVATRDGVAGVPAPSIVIADRWGEIVVVESADHVSELPTAEELVDWVRFVAQACPECEGETR